MIKVTLIMIKQKKVFGNIRVVRWMKRLGNKNQKKFDREEFKGKKKKKNYQKKNKKKLNKKKNLLMKIGFKKKNNSMTIKIKFVQSLELNNKDTNQLIIFQKP